ERREAVEAEKAAAVGERGEEVEQRFRVRASGCAQAESRAVAEDDVHGLIVAAADSRPHRELSAGKLFGVDPLAQFHDWYSAAGVDVPEAMALATASADGVPSVR